MILIEFYAIRTKKMINFDKLIASSQLNVLVHFIKKFHPEGSFCAELIKRKCTLNFYSFKDKNFKNAEMHLQKEKLAAVRCKIKALHPTQEADSCTTGIHSRVIFPCYLIPVPVKAGKTASEIFSPNESLHPSLPSIKAIPEHYT